MNLLLLLNELSETPPAAELRGARERMERFIEMMNGIQKSVRRARPVLRLHRQFNEVELAPGYPVARWRNDDQVRKEQRQLLSKLLTNSPLLPPVDPEGPQPPEDRYDCYHQGRHGRALSVAYRLGGLPVSLLSDPCWDMAWLQVTTVSLEDLSEAEHRLHHASSVSHVTEHLKWLQDFDRITVRDGLELWDRRVELFPALEFCKEVRGQLADFRGGEPALEQIVRRLLQLQEFFSGWDGTTSIGPDSLPCKCTPESPSTLGKYANEHTFTRSEGQRLLFSWHVRFTPEPGRIFFHGDAESHLGVVGFIGRNGLPTVKAPT